MNATRHSSIALALAVLFALLALPALLFGFHLAADTGTILLFPVPTALCVSIACILAVRAERLATLAL